MTPTDTSTERSSSAAPANRDEHADRQRHGDRSPDRERGPSTPPRSDRDTKTSSPDMDRRHQKTVPEREDALDDALDDSFPASDPVAPATTPQPPVKPRSAT